MNGSHLESGTPRPIDQILSQEQIRNIKEQTRLGREANEPLTNTGDYQIRLRKLGIPNPTNFFEESRLYIQQQLTGNTRVNVVDFEAGGAATTLALAAQFANEVKAGKVRFVITNTTSNPTPQIFQSSDYQKLLKKVTDENLVDFQRADIIELYEDLKEPAHLMLILNPVLDREMMGDAILKVISKIVHPREGTIVMARGDSRTLLEGIDALKQQGFNDRYESGRVSLFVGTTPAQLIFLRQDEVDVSEEELAQQGRIGEADEEEKRKGRELEIEIIRRRSRKPTSELRREWLAYRKSIYPPDKIPESLKSYRVDDYAEIDRERDKNMITSADLLDLHLSELKDFQTFRQVGIHSDRTEKLAWKVRDGLLWGLKHSLGFTTEENDAHKGKPLAFRSPRLRSLTEKLEATVTTTANIMLAINLLLGDLHENETDLVPIRDLMQEKRSETVRFLDLLSNKLA